MVGTTNIHTRITTEDYSLDDRNGCRLNLKEIMLKLYRIIMKLCNPKIDPYDRSYILYNIGLIHTRNGEHTKALEYYFRALERNPFLPQASNNMAVICHYGRNLTTYSDRGEQAIQQGDSEIVEAWFDQVAEYWKQAIALTLGNYIEAQNWLKITRRFE
ncbi:hypothetical protein UlMin_008003 [Ulmus minor]